MEMSYVDLDMLVYPPLVESPKRVCKKKESDMIATANAATATITATTEMPGRREKDYMISRLDVLFEGKREELRKHFHMDSQTPNTPKELMQMLKDGHYELDHKQIDRYSSGYDDPDDPNIYWGNVFGFLKFRNPKHKKDGDGYLKAMESLRSAKQKTKDVIIIKPIDDGFLALEAFENNTFH